MKKNRESLLSNSFGGIASNASIKTAAAGRHHYNPKSTTTRPATAKSSCTGSNYKKTQAEYKRYSLYANSS